MADLLAELNQKRKPVNLLAELQSKQQQDPTIGQQILGGAENVASFATSAIAEPIAGLAGIAQSINPFAEEGAGAKAVEDVRNALTFNPITETGQAQQKKIGSAASAIEENVVRPALAGTAGLAKLALNPSQGIEGAQQTVKAVREKGLGQAAGEQALSETGSPLIASIISSIPTAAGLIAPFAKPAGSIIKPTPLQESLANKISSGSSDKKFVKLITDGAGKIRKDKVAVETLKQGFDEGVIAAIKGSSKKDKSNMLKMIDTLEKGKENALFAAKNRPADVAGNALLKRVAHVKKVNSQAGKRLDSVAKSLKGESIDLNADVKGFFNGLNDLGVSFDTNLKPNFTGSQIETIAPAKKLVKDLTLRIKRNPNADAFDAHNFKRFIDENVTFGKSAKGLGGKTERLAKQLRASIDSKLDASFPEYDKVNTQFSDTVKAIDALQDSAGSKVDLFGDNASKATGTVLRRLMGNTQSRVNLMDAIDEIETVGRKHGGKFDDDILTQMLFADELDKMFGAPGRTSFQGEISKALGTQARKTASERAIDAAGGLAEKAVGINEKNALKSIKQLLGKDK